MGQIKQYSVSEENNISATGVTYHKCKFVTEGSGQVSCIDRTQPFAQHDASRNGRRHPLPKETNLLKSPLVAGGVSGIAAAIGTPTVCCSCVRVPSALKLHDGRDVSVITKHTMSSDEERLYV